jgi:hypothetical protein
MHKYIQELKNNLVHKYFENRIYQESNPYKVLGRKNPYKVIFILSHMRSGSSLLTHILASNPEVIGFGESHLKYSSELDFKKLMMKVYCQFQEFKNFPEDLTKFSMDHTYILDKVLHNQKFLDNSFLRSEQIYTIFLIREPQRTFASLLDLKPHWNQEDAFNYYGDRLLKLQEYAQIINNKKRTLLITHAQILNQTDRVLETLQNFLGTKVAFSEEYNILESTGKRDIGDYRGNIKAGKIIRTPRKLNNYEISPELIEKGVNLYDECRNKLSKYCQTIDT